MIRLEDLMELAVSTCIFSSQTFQFPLRLERFQHKSLASTESGQNDPNTDKTRLHRYDFLHKQQQWACAKWHVILKVFINSDINATNHFESLLKFLFFLIKKWFACKRGKFKTFSKTAVSIFNQRLG